MTQPLVSVIVPVSDDVSGLRTTLGSLRDMATALPFEIIVCDDCGPLAIRALADEFGCRYVRLDSNAGSYAARNAGIAAACGRWLAFVDADQRVGADWLDAGCRALERDPYVGGRIIVRAEDMSDSWIRYDCHRGFPHETYVRNGAFPTANLFLDSQVLRQLGPFREDLRSTGDTEFGARVRQAGLRQVFAAAAVTYHPARNRTQQLRKIRRIAAGRAQLYLQIRGQRWSAVVASELMKMALSPPRLLWRILTRLREARGIGVPDHVRFFVFDEILLIKRSLWIIAYARQIRSGSFQPFQDAPIGDRSR